MQRTIIDTSSQTLRWIGCPIGVRRGRHGDRDCVGLGGEILGDDCVGLWGGEIAGDYVTTSDEYLAAANDKNPFVITAKNSDEVLKKGKELFTAMCQHCHGEKGDGNGPMVASGAYVGVPNYATLTNLSDGQIFYSIYYGKGMMGSHGSLLNKKEIWTLVHYVRQFQNKDYGKFDATGKPMALMVADSTKMKP